MYLETGLVYCKYYVRLYVWAIREHHTWGFLLPHLHLKLSSDVGNLFGGRFATAPALLRWVTLEVDKSHLAVVGAGELASLQSAKKQK